MRVDPELLREIDVLRKFLLERSGMLLSRNDALKVHLLTTGRVTFYEKRKGKKKEFEFIKR